jgi:hypothetical protein
MLGAGNKQPRCGNGLLTHTADWISIAVNEPLRTTLVDAVRFLDRHRMPYAVIGGIAVSLRGEPRVTADVDVVIGTDVAGALQLLDAIQPTPFEPLFQGAEEVVERTLILPLRHTASGVKLDIAVGLSGFERQTIARATPVDFRDFSVAIATAEDLLIMKVLASRPRDIQDARGIIAAQAPNLDWEYCLQLAADLGKAVDQDLVGIINSLRRETQEQTD